MVIKMLEVKDVNTKTADSNQKAPTLSVETEESDNKITTRYLDPQIPLQMDTDGDDDEAVGQAVGPSSVVD